MNRSYDAGARFYAPYLGMFTQLDSVTGKPADPRSMNRFLYAEGNPWTFIDPSGHMIGCASASSDLCDETTAVKYKNTPAGKKAAKKISAHDHDHPNAPTKPKPLATPTTETDRGSDNPSYAYDFADRGQDNASLTAGGADQSGGLTGGWCLNGAVNVGIHIGGSACMASDWNGDSGLVLSPSVLTQGSTSLGGLVTTGPMLSNARTLDDLSGWFGNAGGSAALGPGAAVSGDLSVGTASDGRSVWVLNAGYGSGKEIGLDPALQLPLEFHGGAVPSVVLKNPTGVGLPWPFNGIQTGLQLVHWAATGGDYNPWQP